MQTRLATLDYCFVSSSAIWLEDWQPREKMLLGMNLSIAWLIPQNFQWILIMIQRNYSFLLSSKFSREGGWTRWRRSGGNWIMEDKWTGGLTLSFTGWIGRGVALWVWMLILRAAQEETVNAIWKCIGGIQPSPEVLCDGICCRGWMCMEHDWACFDWYHLLVIVTPSVWAHNVPQIQCVM